MYSALSNSYSVVNWKNLDKKSLKHAKCESACRYAAIYNAGKF
jgi:hypothetical protein